MEIFDYFIVSITLEKALASRESAATGSVGAVAAARQHRLKFSQCPAADLSAGSLPLLIPVIIIIIIVITAVVVVEHHDQEQHQQQHQRRRHAVVNYPISGEARRGAMSSIDSRSMYLPAAGRSGRRCGWSRYVSCRPRSLYAPQCSHRHASQLPPPPPPPPLTAGHVGRPSCRKMYRRGFITLQHQRDGRATACTSYAYTSSATNRN